MINPKLKELVEIISSSSDKEERKRFEEFLQSPYFNKSERNAKFCLYLVKSSEEGMLSDISEKLIKSSVFGGESVTEKKFSSLCTNAKKLFEEFIILKEFENASGLQSNLLLKSLSRFGAQRNFDSLAKRIESNYKKVSYHDNEYFAGRIMFQKSIIERKGIEFEKDLSKEYFHLSDYVDKQFAISKLELLNSFISRKYHVLGKEKTELNLLEEAVRYVEDDREHFRKNETAIFSEYLIHKMMSSEDNEKYFHELFEYVSSNYRKFTQEGLELVYYPLINYGSNRAALGDNIFLNYVFRIYQSFEKNGFYGRLKSFQDLDFISIIIISLRVGKTQWTEKFQKKYSGRLNAETGQDTENLSRGLTEFSKKNYKDAVRFIEKVNYINSYYYLKCKETLIKIYFEANDIIALIPLLDSTRHYLNRRKNLLSIHYKRYVDFLKCVKQLVQVSQKDDKGNAYKIRNELRSNHNIISHDWLLEKYNEMIHK